jgi:protein required for attachment to host cells
MVEPAPEHRPATDPPKLREVESLTDAEGSMKGNEIFSNTRSGTTGSAGGQQHTYDDHREGHRQEVERQFAKRVAQTIGVVVRDRAAEKLVIAAEPRMLGLLRTTMTGVLTDGTKVLELSEDLSRHTPEKIQSALAKRGALDGAVTRSTS